MTVQLHAFLEDPLPALLIFTGTTARQVGLQKRAGEPGRYISARGHGFEPRIAARMVCMRFGGRDWRRRGDWVFHPHRRPLPAIENAASRQSRPRSSFPPAAPNQGNRGAVIRAHEPAWRRLILVDSRSSGEMSKKTGASAG